MVTIMKTGPYDPVIAGLDKYESLKRLTLQQSDPGLLTDEAEKYLVGQKQTFKTVKRVITSCLRRTKETADYLRQAGFLDQAVKQEEQAYLNEIKFDLGALCSSLEYEQRGSDIVRERFLDFFIQDRLAEKRGSIQKRLDIFKKELGEINLSAENSLCISHTFFIKLFLTYQKRPDLFIRPEIIREEIDPQTRIMEFCEGSFVNLL